jgi:serine/threonine protein kinase
MFSASMLFFIAPQIFKFRDKAAHLKMKKQVTAMEATGHFNILKTYDHFDEEDDGTFYVVSFLTEDQIYQCGRVTCLQVNELARGGELFDHCVSVNGNGPMPEQGLQLAIRQLLRGLARSQNGKHSPEK